MRLLLDTGILARACHPSRYRDVQKWLYAIAARRPPVHELLVSPISLYELRRALTRRGAGASLEQLSRLTQHLIGLPVTIDVVEEAAALAERVAEGHASAADADLLLAAQAKLGAAVWVRADESLASVASSLGVDVRSWRTIDAAG
jgi:predicted nucleic acid-binding protein